LKESPKHTDQASLVPLARSAFVTGTAVEPVGPRAELTEQPQEARVDNGTISSHPPRRMSILGLPSPSDSPSSKDVTQNETETRTQTLTVGWHKRVFEVFVRQRGPLVKFTKSLVLAAKVRDYSFCSVAHHYNFIDS